MRTWPEWCHKCRSQEEIMPPYALWRVYMAKAMPLDAQRRCGRPGSRWESWVGASCSQTVLMPSSPGAALPLRTQSQQELWPLLVLLWDSKGGPEGLTPGGSDADWNLWPQFSHSQHWGLRSRPEPAAVCTVSASCCVPRRSASSPLLPRGSHSEKPPGLSFFLPANRDQGSPAEKEAEVSTPPHTNALTAWILFGCS